MNVHMIYFYGFVIYCVLAIVIGVVVASKKDSWDSRTMVVLGVIFSIIGGFALLFILMLGTPDGTTWP